MKFTVEDLLSLYLALAEGFTRFCIGLGGIIYYVHYRISEGLAVPEWWGLFVIPGLAAFIFRPALIPFPKRDPPVTVEEEER